MYVYIYKQENILHISGISLLRSSIERNTHCWIGLEMDRHVNDLVLALNSLETWPTLLIEIAPCSTKPL